MKNKSHFATQKEFFKYLIQNKGELIALKKSAVKYSDPLAVDIAIANKSLSTSYQDEPETIRRKVIANTYNWLDSHGDVHDNGVFSSSIKQKGVEKIFHLRDHKFEITAKVGNPVSIAETKIDWVNLGVNKSGQTESLILETDIKRKLSSTIFDAYKAGEVNQHSVGMRYIKIELALDDKEEKSEYEVWLSKINEIGNKEKAIAEGYFWLIKEAALIEVSAVLSGSNELTPTIENKLLTTDDIYNAVDKLNLVDLNLLYEKLKKSHEQTPQNKFIDLQYIVKNLNKLNN